ncbi:MAG: TRAP transporter large permease [Candidatus Methanomethyliaceae archaeon]
MTEIQIISWVLVFLLLVLLGLGVEIAVAMGVTASVAFAFLISQPQSQIAWSAWLTLNSFELLAMPFFILMGTIMGRTGSIGPLFAAVEKILGRTPGGLLSAVIISNAFFGAMSGSSVGAAATFASVAFPEMEKKGYNPRLALGAIAAAGTLSVLIPPSLLFIVYGVWEGISVSRLFAAGVVPGIILTALMVGTVILYSLFKPDLFPKSRPWSWKEKMSSLGPSLPALGLIAGVLGAVFAGIMTPTEASALGACLSVVVALLSGNLNSRILKSCIGDTVKTTAMIGFLLFSARLVAYVFGYAGLPQALSLYLLRLGLGKYGLLCAIIIFYVILGCLIDSLSMMVLTMPFVMPIIEQLGFDKVWWGVVFVLLAEIGLITPPFGLNLFVIQGIMPRYSIGEIAKGAAIFLIGMAVVIALLVTCPDLALFLPRALFG